MFRRDLRGSDTWCGLHNIVLLVMAGVMLMTAEASAARVSNSFVTIEGDGVYVCDDGRIGFSAGPERSVTATARSGWRVNGRDSVSFKTSPGVFMTLKMTSAFGEDGETVDCEEDEDPEDDGNPADDEDPEDDDGEEEDDPEDDDECDWEAYYETNHVAGTSCAVKVTVDPERQAVMYAFPAKGTNVSVSADYEVVARAKHEVYRRWRCAKHQNCDKTHDPEEEFVESFDVEPDTFAWTATGTNGTVRSSAWSGFLSKGLDQKVAFELKASKSGCGAPGCRCEASEKAYVDVYELSIDLPDEYLGLDLTDAMKGRDVTRTATAKIDPAPASATYKWTSCGRCKFIGGKDAASVTYGGNDKTGGSESYLAEPLSVTATAKNAAGQSASATCTTNFTVVAVNVSVGGAEEGGEESEGVLLSRMSDEVPQNARNWKESVREVAISCLPENLPAGTLVSIEVPGNTFYEMCDDAYKLLGGNATFSVEDLKSRKFALCGHAESKAKCDQNIVARIEPSQAIDKGCMTVLSYSFTGFVDRPSGGKDWNLDGFNVDAGHAFWSFNCSNPIFDLTLNNNVHVNRQVGFYSDGMHDPDVTHTPDVTHVWLISRKAFLRGMEFTYAQILGQPQYNLSTNNCCNMMVEAAHSSGIWIARTIAKWPGGGGLCPNRLGIDIINGNWQYEE